MYPAASTGYGRLLRKPKSPNIAIYQFNKQSIRPEGATYENNTTL